MINWLRGLFGGTIRARVLKVINDRLEVMERMYREERANLREKFWLRMDDLKDELSAEEEALIEKHVNNVLKNVF